VIRQLIDHVADPAAGPRRDRARARLAGLTERERTVALALGQGWSNAEIGAELSMSVPTVKGHVSRLLAKLGLNNRVQVALLVHDAELLVPKIWNAACSSAPSPTTCRCSASAVRCSNRARRTTTATTASSCSAP
jgi:DNA-binding CsgD family transcriptional regulator